MSAARIGAAPSRRSRRPTISSASVATSRSWPETLPARSRRRPLSRAISPETSATVLRVSAWGWRSISASRASSRSSRRATISRSWAVFAASPEARPARQNPAAAKVKTAIAPTPASSMPGSSAAPNRLHRAMAEAMIATALTAHNAQFLMLPIDTTCSTHDATQKLANRYWKYQPKFRPNLPGPQASGKLSLNPAPKRYQERNQDARFLQSADHSRPGLVLFARRDACPDGAASGDFRADRGPSRWCSRQGGRCPARSGLGQPPHHPPRRRHGDPPSRQGDRLQHAPRHSDEFPRRAGQGLAGSRSGHDISAGGRARGSRSARRDRGGSGARRGLSRLPPRDRRVRRRVL